MNFCELLDSNDFVGTQFRVSLSTYLLSYYQNISDLGKKDLF